MSQTSFLMLRIGLAFVFLYAAISSFLDPSSWIGFFPPWLQDIPGALPLFSIIEILLALWLLSGKKLFFASWVSAALLLGIVVFNLGALDILFRDIGLLLASLALTVSTKKGAYPPKADG